jgi:hypothetical protein
MITKSLTRITDSIPTCRLLIRPNYQLAYNQPDQNYFLENLFFSAAALFHDLHVLGSALV